MSAPPAVSRQLSRFAWGVLAYNLIVIAWGAFVRATGSGAGCGRHWPLCNGEVIPHPQKVETLIEAGHRGTSGIALIAVVALLVWTFRAVPKGHVARKSAVLAMVSMLGEAILGAGLVLLELVAGDKSIARGFSIVLHLGNTFVLLAALTMTAWWLTMPLAEGAREKLPRMATGFVLFAMTSVMIVAGAGAIAALGDTLFPSRSLREGLAQDLGPMSHVFLKLRLLHPFLACASGVVVIAASRIARAVRPASSRVRLASIALTLLFCLQMAAGLLNVSLLAPVWMQLVHLLFADFTWIALVIAAIEMRWGLESNTRQPIMSRNGPGPIKDVPPSISSVEPVT